MSKVSNIIKSIASCEQDSQTSAAMLMIASVLEANNCSLTIVADQTVQDIEEDDVFIGSDKIKLRGITIELAGLKIENRKFSHHADIESEIISNKACLLSYSGNNGEDRKILVIMSRESGAIYKKKYIEEAFDYTATNCEQNDVSLVLSQNDENEFERVEPCSIRSYQTGFDLGNGKIINWDEVTALTTQNTLSIALGRNKVVTLSEC